MQVLTTARRLPSPQVRDDDLNPAEARRRAREQRNALRARARELVPEIGSVLDLADGEEAAAAAAAAAAAVARAARAAKVAVLVPTGAIQISSSGAVVGGAVVGGATTSTAIATTTAATATTTTAATAAAAAAATSGSSAVPSVDTVNGAGARDGARDGARSSAATRQLWTTLHEGAQHGAPPQRRS
jgi:hypothetical protein